MTVAFAEALVAVLAAAASLFVFAMVRRRTLAAVPAVRATSDAGRS